VYFTVTELKENLEEMNWMYTTRGEKEARKRQDETRWDKMRQDETRWDKMRQDETMRQEEDRIKRRRIKRQIRKEEKWKNNWEVRWIRSRKKKRKTTKNTHTKTTKQKGVEAEGKF